MEELLDPVLLPDRVDVGDAVVREVREVKVDLEEKKIFKLFIKIAMEPHIECHWV